MIMVGLVCLVCESCLGKILFRGESILTGQTTNTLALCLYFVEGVSAKLQMNPFDYSTTHFQRTGRVRAKSSKSEPWRTMAMAASQLMPT